MFAKLKKKIETDGGAVGAESPGRSGGGLSRHSSVSSLPGAGMIPRLRDGPSPPGSVTSEDFSMRDPSANREDVMLLLQKKTEQCRKLEGNISDLAALIKDKSKTIEKLEANLKQQDEVTNQKLQDQKAEFEKYRDKLIQGYQEEKIKLDKLLNTEEALSKCRTDLEVKTQQCQAAENQVEKLTDELAPLRQRLVLMESDNEKLREETRERAELVTSLTKEKSVFDSRLDETNSELTEKHGQISALQVKMADLENELQTLQRNSDLHRNKTSKLLQEKDDHLDTLRERVQTLEQRISDSALSGDDRTSALQTERDSLEQRLSEARQQLTEVKSTWSDKITHLEGQISNLNAKIVEDCEELASNQKQTDQMRESFHKQIEDLRLKLEEAEKRALENLELASSKDLHYEKQLQDMESEITKQRLSTIDSDTQLRAKISTLEAELTELTAARDMEREESKSRIAHLEEREVRFTERETRLVADARDLEQRLTSLQAAVEAKDAELKALRDELSERDCAGQGQDSLIGELRRQISALEQEVDMSQKGKAEYEKHLRSSEEDKGGLLERNAELYQEIQAVKATSSESRLELQRTLDLKSQTIDSMLQTEAGLRGRVEALERQIEQSEISKAESGLYSDRIEEMTNMIASLQSQLGDKSRTIKKQEQTLKDLRVTLQRELKVQALPNDETSDQTFNNVASSHSPSAARKFDTPTRSDGGSNSRGSHHQQQQQQVQQQYSDGSTQQQQSHFQTAQYGNPTAAVLPMQSYGGVTSLSATSPSVPSARLHEASSSSSSPSSQGNWHKPKVADKEVNVQYLKHVVLKFMLSRESEAIQLIKAVSMLLNFSQQEQQLIKETLEWKMSWFGHRPPLGQGQTSK